MPETAALLTETAPPLAILAAIRAPFQAFGGDWVDAPVLQPLTLLLDLAGEAMRGRLFVVQGEGAAEACLRPDFTIPIASAHLASGAAEGRYLYEGKAFRSLAQAHDRPVEFLQIGVEVYGGAADPIQQDAEVAALAWRAAAAGGRSDLGLVLGDVALFGGFLTALDLPQGVQARLKRAFAAGRSVKTELARSETQRAPVTGGRMAQLLSDLPEGEAAQVLDELWKLAGIRPVGGRSAAEIAHRLSIRGEQTNGPHLSPAEADLIGRYLDIVAPPHQALERIEALAYEAKVEFDLQLQPWVHRLKALVDAGVPEHAVILSPGFVRPFGYYDGALFEIRSLALGFEQPVAAGGRYDGFLGRLGAMRPGGAVGCMVRPARAWAEGAA
ncbi:MAG: ATP phosphoribosyltransferase regulatory subunit [Caulobacteraceae bacterium]